MVFLSHINSAQSQTHALPPCRFSYFLPSSAQNHVTVDVHAKQPALSCSSRDQAAYLMILRNMLQVTLATHHGLYTTRNGQEDQVSASYSPPFSPNPHARTCQRVCRLLQSTVDTLSAFNHHAPTNCSRHVIATACSPIPPASMDFPLHMPLSFDKREKQILRERWGKIFKKKGTKGKFDFFGRVPIG